MFYWVDRFRLPCRRAWFRGWCGGLRLFWPFSLAVVASACLLSAQSWYAPSNSWSLPADPAHGIPQTRHLDPAEMEVLDRMQTAAEEYVRRNPKYAPQLSRFRETVRRLCVRRGVLPKTLRWRTLPDFLKTGGGAGRWVEPGGRSPDGQIMPPNILLVNDGQIDGASPACDPPLGCSQRAVAIVICIHEGFRQGNAGVSEGGELDCALLLNVIATYAADMYICNDLLTNGVPVTGPPNPTDCFLFTAEQRQPIVSRLDYAKDMLKAACDDARAKGCPVPPECPPE